MKWFRLHTEARTDRKLDTLTDAEFRVWFNLLCLSAEQPERGVIHFQDEEILALEVAKGDVELLRHAMSRLSRLRSVTLGDGCVTFVNFNKRQYDKPSDFPEHTRERQQKSRATKRESGEGGVTPRDTALRHATDTDTDTDTDTEKKESPTSVGDEKDATASPRAPRKFRLPLDWIPSEANRTYAQSRGMTDAEIDAEAEKFRDHFTGINPEARPGWDASWRQWIGRALELPGPRAVRSTATGNGKVRFSDRNETAAPDDPRRNVIEGVFR